MQIWLSLYHVKMTPIMQNTLPSVHTILRSRFRIGIIMHENSFHCACEKHSEYIPLNAKNRKLRWLLAFKKTNQNTQEHQSCLDAPSSSVCTRELTLENCTIDFRPFPRRATTFCCCWIGGGFFVWCVSSWRWKAPQEKAVMSPIPMSYDSLRLCAVVMCRGACTIVTVSRFFCHAENTHIYIYMCARRSQRVGWRKFAFK